MLIRKYWWSVIRCHSLSFLNCLMLLGEILKWIWARKHSSRVLIGFYNEFHALILSWRYEFLSRGYEFLSLHNSVIQLFLRYQSWWNNICIHFNCLNLIFASRCKYVTILRFICKKRFFYLNYWLDPRFKLYSWCFLWHIFAIRSIPSVLTIIFSNILSRIRRAIFASITLSRRISSWRFLCNRCLKCCCLLLLLALKFYWCWLFNY